MTRTSRFRARGEWRGWLFRVAVVLAATATVAWGYGFYRFAQMIPERAPPLEMTTDAIVVLTGGTGRVHEGLTLLESGAARKLFVSGVYRGVDVQALLRVAQRNTGELDCCIILGYAADSTRGNARETADWIREENLKSIRLVTASYHMPRSLLEFRRSLPPDVSILAHPVFPERFRQSDWWRWWGSGWLAVSEYHKYALARLIPPTGGGG